MRKAKYSFHLNLRVYNFVWIYNHFLFTNSIIFNQSPNSGCRKKTIMKLVNDPLWKMKRNCVISSLIH